MPKALKKPKNSKRTSLQMSKEKGYDLFTRTKCNPFKGIDQVSDKQSLRKFVI